MGLTTVNVMVEKRDLPVTMSDFIDHIDHIVKLVGIDHRWPGQDPSSRLADRPERQGSLPGKPTASRSSKIHLPFPLPVEGRKV